MRGRFLINRRLAGVVLGTAAAVALVAAVLVYERGELRRQLHRQRDAAVAAVQRGEYRPAIEPLYRYVRREGQRDVEAAYHLATALHAISRADRGAESRQIAAAWLLQKVLQHEPEHLPALRLLATIYDNLHFDLELLGTLDRIAALAPAEAADLLPVRTQALARLGRFDEARAAAERTVAHQPEDLATRRLLLEILDQGPWPRRELVAEATALRRARPNDPQALLLAGYAYRLAGREPEAAQLYRRVMEGQLPDAASIRLLARELEAVHLFGDAVQVLRHGVARFPDDADLTATLAHRLWTRSTPAEALEQLQSLDVPSLDEAPTDLLAIQAMAMMQVDADDAAQPILALIRQRRPDPAATAWEIFLGDVFDQHFDAATAIHRYRDALEHDPTNPYIQFALGQALRDRGEWLEAAAAWTAACEHAPAWVEPRLSLARAYIELGLGYQAVLMAEEARLRAPNDSRTDIVLAQARAAHLREGGGDSPEALLELVERIQTRQPYEPQTLPLYVWLLLEVGQRDDAVEVSLVALDRPLPEGTLIQLAEVSRSAGLGLAEACYAHARSLKDGQPSPRLAYARAVHLWKLGRIDQALALLLPPDDTTSGEPQPSIGWQLARARFFDEVGAPEALPAWRRLAALARDDLAVQRQVLEAKAVQNDPELLQQTIDRVRTLAGNSSLTWRVVEARRVLAEDPSREQAASVALLLGQVVRRAATLVEPRLLLARCYERLDNLDAAVEQLETAYALAPRSRKVTLELARLSLEREDRERALVLLQQVAENRAATAEELQATAMMLVRLRGWDAAADALSRALQAGGHTPQGLVFAPLGTEAEGNHADPPMPVSDNDWPTAE